MLFKAPDSDTLVYCFVGLRCVRQAVFFKSPFQVSQIVDPDVSYFFN